MVMYVTLAEFIGESDDWQRGYDFAMNQVQRKTCDGCVVPSRHYLRVKSPCIDCCRNEIRPDYFEPKEVE